MANAFWKSSLVIFAVALVAADVSVMEGAAAAEAKLTPACRVAKSYIDLINARDVNGVRDLFAEKTDYTGPNGLPLTTRDEVGKSYERGLTSPTSKTWQFRVANLAPFGKSGCLLEFETAFQPDQFELAAVDHFEVDAQGKVVKFMPYVASPQLRRIAAHVQSKEEMAEHRQ